MHVIQYIATRAGSVDEAHSNVKHYLEGQLGDDPYTSGSAAWFDWFVTGGGRWASDEKAQYDNDYTADVVHQSNPKFVDYLDTAHKYRWQELEAYEKEARLLNLSDLLDTLQDFEHDHYTVGSRLYPLKKIYDLCMGIWDYQSYFYDMEHESTNRIHMLQAIDKGEDNWYLVPVDFHF